MVVKGSVGHMSAFLAQAGSLVVLGDTGDAFGDSLYGAKLFVRGSVKSPGRGLHRRRWREHKAAYASCSMRPGRMPTYRNSGLRFGA